MAKLGIDTLCQKSVEIWEPEDSTVSILFPNFIIKDLKAPSGMLLEELCPVLLQVPKYFGLAYLFLPNILLIYILCRSQTYCARPKDDFHSVILVFVPAQNILEQH